MWELKSSLSVDGYAVASFDRDFNTWWLPSPIAGCEVTHWMTLPPDPEDECWNNVLEAKMAIRINYDCAPPRHCMVCDARFYSATIPRNSPSTYGGAYILCSSCMADPQVTQRIGELEAYYSHYLPGRFRSLFLATLDRSIVGHIRHLRAAAREETTNQANREEFKSG